MDNQHTSQKMNEISYNSGTGDVARMPIFSSERPMTEAERAEQELRGQVGRVGLRVSETRNGLFGRNKDAGRMNAKDLTAEIDRATDIELKAGMQQAIGQDRPSGMFGNGVGKNTTGGGKDVVKNTTFEQGGAALEGLATAGGVNNNFNHEQYQQGNKGLRQAEEEIRRDEKEMVGGLAGDETKVQTAEYLRDDAEDLKIEDGKGREHEILTKSQNGLTKEWRAKTEEAIKKENPREIEQFRNLGMFAMLNAYDRKFGRAS